MPAAQSQLVQSISPWPHRLAVALVLATFPMIWIGGLVTTYRAGMAVTDYPTTFGYNLFLYPWQTWLTGPWKLFIEHGHRLWGASVTGPTTIAFVLVAWRCDDRRWLRWLAVVALLAVIGQGLLGGMRVRMDEILFARIHGCVGPAFFGLTVALAVFTSRLWREREPAREIAHGDSLRRMALATVALAYVQLVLGSGLRHMPAGASPGDFRAAALFHVLVALALVGQVAVLTFRVVRSARGEGALTRPAAGLCLLVALQIALGLGTWIVKYGWPIWLGGEHLAGFVVQAEGRLQAQITTAHVAVGSLILAVSLVVALRSWRLVRGVPARPVRREVLELVA